MQFKQRRCQVVWTTAITAVASAGAWADVSPLTLDTIPGGSSTTGIYIISPGGMSFQGSIGGNELNVGGVAPAPVGAIVGVLAPSDTSLNGLTFLGSIDVGVSNFRFHSTHYDDPDNWDNPLRVYGGPGDLLIAIPSVPVRDDVVFSPPGVPALASSVTFSNGTFRRSRADAGGNARRHAGARLHNVAFECASIQHPVVRAQR